MRRSGALLISKLFRRPILAELTGRSFATFAVGQDGIAHVFRDAAEGGPPVGAVANAEKGPNRSQGMAPGLLLP